MGPANKLTFILSTSLATPNTIIPFFTSDAAIPAPIPELAPVTNAALPHQRSILFSGLYESKLMAKSSPF